MPTTEATQFQRYPCVKCGSQLEYKPGATVLVCPYCGAETPIAPPAGAVEELPYEQYLDKAILDPSAEAATALHCNACGAEFTVPPNQETQECPFCGSRVIAAAQPVARIAPNGMLPFELNEKAARGALDKWLGSRFWAPRDLRSMALKEGRLRGMYVPYWTYDCFTTTQYTGMRGEHYWETVTYTDSDGNTQTRQEMRTRWWPAAGVVTVPFDDVLVLSSRAVPERYAQRLHTWDLQNCVPYDTGYIAGFQTMRYDVDLANGFAKAQEFMEPAIQSAIRCDIGGDEQQILTHATEYANITFKNLLLPIWLGGYRYRSKPFRMVINARTGEVQGEAPVSVWKVIIAILIGLAVLGAILLIARHNR